MLTRTLMPSRSGLKKRDAPGIPLGVVKQMLTQNIRLLMRRRAEALKDPNHDDDDEDDKIVAIIGTGLLSPIDTLDQPVDLRTRLTDCNFDALVCELVDQGLIALRLHCRGRTKTHFSTKARRAGTLPAFLLTNSNTHKKSDLNSLAERRAGVTMPAINSLAGSERVRCRNQRCRSKLSTPTSNDHKAFCSPYCYNQFFHWKCAVCEKSIFSGARRRKQPKCCRSPKCNKTYKNFTRNLHVSPPP